MTMATPASNGLIESYEALRSRVTQGEGASAGLTLFLTRGMAAWMQVSKEYAPPLPRTMLTKADRVRVIIPAGLQGDLVMALASLTLNVRRGGKS